MHVVCLPAFIVAACLVGLPVAAQPAGAVSGGGFQQLSHQAGSGVALVRRGSGERSARQLAQQSLQMLAAGLDRPPRALGGMVSKQDDAAMLSFAGHQRGALLQGYLVAQISPRGYTVAVAMDAPARLERTAPLLLAAADVSGGGGAAAGPSPYRNLSWTSVPFGTGQVSLPQGWRVVGQYQGAVDIAGPNGEGMSLGTASQVMTPQAAQQYRAMTGMPPQVYVAPATADPVAAFGAVRPQIEQFTLRNGGAVVRVSRVREADRISFGNMAAGLIASEGTAPGGQPYRQLSLVAAGGVMANGNWLYYTSEAYAPAQLYPQALPVMLKIWNSWTVDKKVLMERLIGAARAMRETNEILSGIHDNQQQSQDRLSEAWGHALRGTVVVGDNQTGRQSTEWLYQPGPAAGGIGVEHNRHMSDAVRDANQAAGYERWQILNP